MVALLASTLLLEVWPLTHPPLVSRCHGTFLTILVEHPRRIGTTHAFRSLQLHQPFPTQARPGHHSPHLLPLIPLPKQPLPATHRQQPLPQGLRVQTGAQPHVQPIAVAVVPRRGPDGLKAQVGARWQVVVRRRQHGPGGGDAHD